MSSFNTFGKRTREFGNGKNIWHEITGKYPGGGSVTNLSDFSGVIPAGSMVVFDHAKHQATIVDPKKIKTATQTSGTIEPKTINGLLENDIWLEDVTDYATATVVYAGKIYVDRLKDEIPAEVLAVLPEIHALNEK